jgi:hypothetical protein
MRWNNRCIINLSLQVPQQTEMLVSDATKNGHSEARTMSGSVARDRFSKASPRLPTRPLVRHRLICGCNHELSHSPKGKACWLNDRTSYTGGRCCFSRTALGPLTPPRNNAAINNASAIPHGDDRPDDGDSKRLWNVGKRLQGATSQKTVKIVKLAVANTSSREEELNP